MKKYIIISLLFVGCASTTNNIKSKIAFSNKEIRNDIEIIKSANSAIEHYQDTQNIVEAIINSIASNPEDIDDAGAVDAEINEGSANSLYDPMNSNIEDKVNVE